MKNLSFAKKAIAAVSLVAAAAGANAAVYNLGGVTVGVPKDFAALSTATSFSDIFTFDLPANGGSGYSVTNFTLLPSALYNTVLTSLTLLTDPDNSVALTGLLNGNESIVTTSVAPGGSSVTMTGPANGGGHYLLYVAGLTTGSAGGIYTGAISASAVTPVPEPESYAMLLAGLGVMGAIALRRNKRKTD